MENESRYCPFCGAGLKTNGHRSSSPFRNEDIQENKIMAILTYFGFLVFIPLFVVKRSRFARYHVKQGMILLAVELLFAICYCVLRAVRIACKLLLVLSATGIMNTVSEKALKRPVIGNIL